MKEEASLSGTPRCGGQLLAAREVAVCFAWAAAYLRAAGRAGQSQRLPAHAKQLLAANERLQQMRSLGKWQGFAQRRVHRIGRNAAEESRRVGAAKEGAALHSHRGRKRRVLLLAAGVLIRPSLRVSRENGKLYRGLSNERPELATGAVRLMTARHVAARNAAALVRLRPAGSRLKRKVRQGVRHAKARNGTPYRAARRTFAWPP